VRHGSSDIGEGIAAIRAAGEVGHVVRTADTTGQRVGGWLGVLAASAGEMVGGSEGKPSRGVVRVGARGDGTWLGARGRPHRRGPRRWRGWPREVSSKDQGRQWAVRGARTRESRADDEGGLG
jgi:hypothetical protein